MEFNLSQSRFPEYNFSFDSKNNAAETDGKKLYDVSDMIEGQRDENKRRLVKAQSESHDIQKWLDCRNEKIKLAIGNSIALDSNPVRLISTRRLHTDVWDQELAAASCQDLMYCGNEVRMHVINLGKREHRSRLDSPGAIGREILKESTLSTKCSRVLPISCSSSHWSYPLFGSQDIFLRGKTFDDLIAKAIPGGWIHNGKVVVAARKRQVYRGPFGKVLPERLPCKEIRRKGDWSELRSAKRKRTIFTAMQLDRLEEEFGIQQYIVGQDRLRLAEELGLNETQVKVWFQNRRIKWRKQQNPGIGDRSPHYHHSLDCLEQVSDD